ncbi:MAG: cytosine permease [Desulfurococcales archaeon]|nr:cytosine permease [Desulfurococcales archaeon]
MGVKAGFMGKRREGLGALEYSLLMFSMTTCLPLFFLGPLAYRLRLSLDQALVAALIGNGVVGLLMVLNGLPGLSEGIDYIEHSKRVFRVLYKIPVFLRGLVGGLWYGVEAFNGALALALILLYGLGYREGLLGEALTILPVLLVVYVASATLVYRKGVAAVGKAASIAGPILMAYFAYLAWSNHVVELSGLDGIPRGVSWTSAAFLGYLAVQTNWWATVAINMSDLSRAARSVRALAVGVLAGMVGGQLLGTYIGYLLAFNSGSALPHEIIIRGSPSPLVLVIGLLFAFLAPWTTDLSANIPALEGLVRIITGIDREKAAVIAGLLGFILAPWYAMGRAQDIVGYVAAFAASYGVLLGPILGAMLAWLVNNRTGGSPAFMGLLAGILAAYAYGYATGTIVSLRLGGLTVPFPPGITIYVGLTAALLVPLLIVRVRR